MVCRLLCKLLMKRAEPRVEVNGVSLQEDFDEETEASCFTLSGAVAAPVAADPAAAGPLAGVTLATNEIGSYLQTSQQYSLSVRAWSHAGPTNGEFDPVRFTGLVSDVSRWRGSRVSDLSRWRGSRLSDLSRWRGSRVYDVFRWRGSRVSRTSPQFQQSTESSFQPAVAPPPV